MSDPEGARAHFNSTQWSLVLAAASCSSPDAREALAALCAAYWYPLYAYVRRRGHSIADAQDLTQEFFVRLLEKNYLKDADPERGKFRSFLLASMKHFLANEWDRANTKKRGGGVTHIALEFGHAERLFEQEDSRALTPEELFERRWAFTLIDRTLARLETEFTRAGKPDLFQALKGCLTGSAGRDSYARVGAKLLMTEGAVKTAAHRMRRRFRDLLRAEIAKTVAAEDQIDDEIRHLMTVVRR